MGCLFVAFAAVAPRILLVLIWLARPEFVDAAFDTIIFPALGLVFLPFTTLTYLVLVANGVGFGGGDWIFLIIAVILDLAHWAANGADARQKSGWRNE